MLCCRPVIRRPQPAKPSRQTENKSSPQNQHQKQPASHKCPRAVLIWGTAEASRNTPDGPKAKPKLRDKRTKSRPANQTSLSNSPPGISRRAVRVQGTMVPASGSPRRTKRTQPTRYDNKQSLNKTARGPFAFGGPASEAPGRRHGRINRIGDGKDKAIRSSCQASVMPVMICNQIRNEFGWGGVRFSRLLWPPSTMTHPRP